MTHKIIAVIAALFILIQSANAQEVGSPAPDFTHNTLDHGQISLSQYQGKVIFLFFFGHN